MSNTPHIIVHDTTAELADGTILTPGCTFRVKGDGARYRFIQKGWHHRRPTRWWIDAVQDRTQPRGGIRSFRPRNIYNIKGAAR